MLYACRRRELGTLPSADSEERVSAGDSVIIDGFEAVEALVSGEGEDGVSTLAPSTAEVLVEQAKQVKLLLSPWARVGLERCVELLEKLQLNGMEITEAPAGRAGAARRLPPRGHNRWAQGKTVGLGLFASGALLNHSCQPNCRLDFGADGFLTVSSLIATCLTCGVCIMAAVAKDGRSRFAFVPE
jgi:hypothetical protein